MTKHFKIMIAIIAVFAVIAATAQATDWRGHGHWRGAWAGHGDHGIERFCGDDRTGHVDTVTALVDNFAALDSEQKAAWARVTAAISHGRGILRDTCGRIVGGDATVPARLARLETLLDAGAQAVAVVRPAADAFYGTLDADQRKALDAITAHRRH